MDESEDSPTTQAQPSSGPTLRKRGISGQSDVPEKKMKKAKPPKTKPQPSKSSSSSTQPPTTEPQQSSIHDFPPANTFEDFKTIVLDGKGEINQEKLLKLCFTLYKRVKGLDRSNDECEGRENICTASVSAIDEKGKENKERKPFSFRLKFDDNQNQYIKREEADRAVESHLKHLNGKYYCNWNGAPCNKSGANGKSNSVRDHIRQHLGLRFYCFYCSCYKGVHSFQGLTRHFQKCHWNIGQIEDPEETIIL